MGKKELMLVEARGATKRTGTMNVGQKKYPVFLRMFCLEVKPKCCVRNNRRSDIFAFVAKTRHLYSLPLDIALKNAMIYPIELFTGLIFLPGGTSNLLH